MKHYWMAVIVAGALTCGAAAQTGASGSASTNTSATAGKSGVNAGSNTNANAQVSGSSASANTGAQADASKKSSDKQSGNSYAGANAGSATNAAANAGGASLSNGTTLQAELTKTLDAKKTKAGDEVTAKVTQDVKSDGKVVVRKGSKLVGHITEAQARSKENAESKLGLVFDRAVLKDGSEVSFNAVVQALAAVQAAPISVGSDDTGMMGGSAGGNRPAPMGTGGSVVGETTNTLGSTVGTVGNTAGSVAGSAAGAANGTVNSGGLAANGALTSASHGVFGMKGVALSSATSGSANTQTSVISSTTQNVKLDSGTQMVLQVNRGSQQ